MKWELNNTAVLMSLRSFFAWHPTLKHTVTHKYVDTHLQAVCGSEENVSPASRGLMDHRSQITTLIRSRDPLFQLSVRCNFCRRTWAHTNMHPATSSGITSSTAAHFLGLHCRICSSAIPIFLLFFFVPLSSYLSLSIFFLLFLYLSISAAPGVESLTITPRLLPSHQVEEYRREEEDGVDRKRRSRRGG